MSLVLLYNCNLLDGSGALPVAQSAVLSQGESIRQVWAGNFQLDELKQFLSEAELVELVSHDLQGRTVMPGLIDMHTHLLDEQNLPCYLAHGVTTLRECGNNLLALQLMEKQLTAGELPGPRLFYSGAFFDGPDLSWPRFTCEVIREVSDLNRRGRLSNHNRDFIKLYTNLPPEVITALVEQSHAEGYYLTAHPGQLNGAALLNSGINGVEHLFSFSRQIAPDYFAKFGPKDTGSDFFRQINLVWLELGRGRLSDTELLRLFQLMAERGVALTPTLALHAPRLLPPADSLRDWLKPDMQLFWQRRNTLAGWTAADFEQAGNAVEIMAQYAVRFYRQGGQLLVGSDSPNSWLVPGWGLHREMELLVQGGLTPLEVIGLATSQAALYLQKSPREGHPEHFGQIAAGYLADLLILENDPSRDIRHCFAPVAVIKGGKFYNPTQLVSPVEQSALPAKFPVPAGFPE